MNLVLHLATDGLCCMLTWSYYRLYTLKRHERRQHKIPSVSAGVNGVFSADGCIVNCSFSSGLRCDWKQCVQREGGWWCVHHHSCPHINTNTLSTVRVVFLHSMDYKASAVSVCLRLRLWLFHQADGLREDTRRKSGGGKKHLVFKESLIYWRNLG